MFNKTFSTVGMLIVALIINATIVLVALWSFRPEVLDALLGQVTFAVFGG
jgi:hypothetical protein